MVRPTKPAPRELSLLSTIFRARTSSGQLEIQINAVENSGLKFSFAEHLMSFFDPLTLLVARCAAAHHPKSASAEVEATGADRSYFLILVALPFLVFYS